MRGLHAAQHGLTMLGNWEVTYHGSDVCDASDAAEALSTGDPTSISILLLLKNDKRISFDRLFKRRSLFAQRPSVYWELLGLGKIP